MSRLTAAEIVKEGRYLDPDFDPATLTVSQLLGVFGFHGITYPMPFSKPKLVAVFNSEIKANGPRLRTARLKAAASIASDDGITDGVTGKPLAAERQQPVRRSSRRLSRAPTEEPEPEPARPDPPKRRRSSAQPNLGGPSRKAIEPVEPVLVEESEPEEEKPVRKIGRKKTLESAGQQLRRVSHAEDSGWEDNNVFQSGAESSSPARPQKRKSTAPKKKRKSVSAPPEMFLPSSSPPRIQDVSPNSPPQSKFEPDLPPSVTREMRLMAPKLPPLSFSPKQDADETFDNGESDYPDDGPTEDFAALEAEEEQEVDEEEEEDYNSIVSRKIAEGGISKPATQAGTAGKLIRVMLFLLSIGASLGVWNFKLESAAIGYCDTNRPTNNALNELRDHRRAVDVCNRDNTTMPGGEPCPLPSLVPHPDTCTPCPAHGKCSQFEVTCDTGYLLEPHSSLFFVPSVAPDLFWRLLRNATDGFPGLGSIGLPPRCVEDRRVNRLGRAAKKELGELRGQRLCAGSHGSQPFTDAQGGDARRWGREMNDLAKVIGARIPKDKAPDNFGALFTEALQQLSRYEEIIIGEDISSKQRFVAAKTPSLTWDCKIIVQSRAVWEEWRAMVYGLFALVVSTIGARGLRSRRVAEDARIQELANTALDTLMAQDRAYHSDPLSASVPYLSSLQLRDVVLAREHSVARRAKLWTRVEKIVEENANVRANLEEVDGGDEMRVWRWIGTKSPTKLE
ncbi:MSC domain-containing protein [Mycena chlorophos]|uniref:MSC domain-containing protein n=1 Tax=Mycena chlorophos TaxID=658473 RepID=A0A8H6TUE5_MYCCL|nr:MSC domain-containing protein [Mycena chlorophos]